jgi:hypothetical protein
MDTCGTCWQYPEGVSMIAPCSEIYSSASFHLAYAWQYPAKAAMSISVRIPSRSICFAIRFHSFFASASSHAGHLGAFFSGFGSPAFSPLFPGFPSSTFTAVGFGFRPLCATALTSLCTGPHTF